MLSAGFVLVQPHARALGEIGGKWGQLCRFICPFPCMGACTLGQYRCQPCCTLLFQLPSLAPLKAYGVDAGFSAAPEACDAHLGVPQGEQLKLREALKARARDSVATATLLVDASQAGTGDCVEPVSACPRTPASAPLTRGRTLSVRRTFSNATVLITGATGYLGSLVRLP